MSRNKINFQNQLNKCSLDNFTPVVIDRTNKNLVAMQK